MLFSASRPFCERVADPAVAAENRHLHAELARLTDDDRGLGVVAGDEHGVRLLAADLGEDGLEVGVAAAVADRVQHLAAERREVLRDRIGEADRVVLLDVLEDGDLPRLEIVVGELGEHLALERIDEADAEDVVADLGDALVGRRRA